MHELTKKRQGYGRFNNEKDKGNHNKQDIILLKCSITVARNTILYEGIEIQEKF